MVLKTIWYFAFLASWGYLLLFQIQHPESPAYLYIDNFSRVVEIVYWLSSFILFLACLGLLWNPLTKLDKELSNIKEEVKTIRYKISVYVSITFLIFLGVLGNWSLFTAYGVAAVLSSFFIALVVD